MGIENILYLVTGLFVLILIVKAVLGRKGEKICAICSAFALTWIFLLILYYMGRFDNLLIIGLLVGLTVLGIYYTWERSVGKEKTIFRLPVLLTLVLVGYYLLTFENLFREIGIIVVLWVLFLALYLYGKNIGLKKFVDKIVGCCRRW